MADTMGMQAKSGRRRKTGQTGHSSRRSKGDFLRIVPEISQNSAYTANQEDRDHREAAGDPCNEEAENEETQAVEKKRRVFHMKKRSRESAPPFAPLEKGPVGRAPSQQVFRL